MKIKKPHILAVIPGYIPSSFVLIEKPLKGLEAKGEISVSVKLNSEVRPSDIQISDLVVFHREIEPASIKLLFEVFRQGKPYIYDIDDNFFELPLDSEIGRLYRRPERQKILKNFIRYAALVQVYSNPMLERAGQLGGRVVKMNGVVDLSMLPKEPPKKKSDKFKIVFATSRDRDELHKLFLPDIKKLLEERGGEFEVTFWGFCPKELKNHPSVRHFKLEPNYDAFMKRFCAEGFDVGLAPLINDIFHRSKTNIKFREYGACFVAGLYSDVDIYTDDIKEGDTGIIIKENSGGWHKAILELSQNPELLNKIKINARHYVEEHFSPEKNQSLWQENIAAVLGREEEIELPEELLRELPISEEPPPYCGGKGQSFFARGLKKASGTIPIKKLTNRYAELFMPAVPIFSRRLTENYPEIVEFIELTYRHFKGFSPRLSAPLGESGFVEYGHPPVNFEFSAVSFAPVVTPISFGRIPSGCGLLGVEIACGAEILRQEKILISDLERNVPATIEFEPLKIDKSEFIVRFFTIGAEDIIRVYEIARRGVRNFAKPEVRAFCSFSKLKR